MNLFHFFFASTTDLPSSCYFWYNGYNKRKLNKMLVVLIIFLCSTCIFSDLNFGVHCETNISSILEKNLLNITFLNGSSANKSENSNNEINKKSAAAAANITRLLSLNYNSNGNNNNNNLNNRHNESNISEKPKGFVSTDHITQACISKCPEENKTTLEHLNVGCGKDCYMRQCSLGCSLWELALDSSCQIVCNKTDDELLEPKELYCVMGCNDAINRYFKWLRSEVGTPQAPALVADSLTATSLSLEWKIPHKLLELTKGRPYSPESFLVQWRYEEVVGDWKFCRNQSMGINSTVRVDDLQPYTKYRFRVALPLSTNYDEILISDQSVIISTLAMGVPASPPAIVRAVAVDHTRISVSWEPGPFPNGPILSYVLQIKSLLSEGYSAIKDIPASENTNFYMFDKLAPLRNYSILVSMRNSEGEGPSAEMIVSTPPSPPIKDNEPEPRLILGAEYSVMSQGSDILSEPPEVFYKSDHKILGMAIHIGKQLVFVSDQAGFIYKAPLERIGKKEVILSPNSGLNFFPNLIALDWLNDHLYILGEVVHPNSQVVWQISRCGLNGQGHTIAIAGLHKKPNHIQVDPYNGYLFWVVTGYAADTGLFRLDLADISNGIKHEITPLHLIQGENLGAFVVDNTKFRILVPPQNKNTVISVTLDGKDREDIRNNTQSPKLNIVKSLAMANGIFYWTNGRDLFMEDHHSEEDIYYHNAYPGISNGSFIAVCVNIPSAQPTPVPVNPPRHVQALLSSRKAKISWRIPHLLGNQGKGAWQEWNYELEIIDGSGLSNVTRGIKGTYFTIDKLKPNTNYTFRAAAYTVAGKGPWSTEFDGKTLKSIHDRYLIWASNDGLLQSDVIGEHIHTLIPRSELGDHTISDMAWFEDVLYFVSNSTLRYYNRTSGVVARFGNLGSVESIGVDWIGKRIYWSNPSQQLIARSSLNGEEREPISIFAVARELKIDSLCGHLYYSTGHAVEACRLNGKNRMIYFSVPLYSGKQVMGLTLDMDNERVFWIVRSYKGSSLFNAPMANGWHKDYIPIEITLEERSLNGPLTHFSDRLLWLQDDHTVIVGDVTGKNLAHIRNSKLNGLKSVSVIDPTHQIYPNLSSSELNVIPEQINNASVRITGNWRSFNISWDPVKTVTYGDVFYEIRIHSENNNDVAKETSVPYFHHITHSIPPYSLLDITLRAFTYWGSCKPILLQLNSPAASSSAPTRPRIFIVHNRNPFKDGLNISATFRWDTPMKPNGPIVGYKVYCWHEENGFEKRICNGTRTRLKEIIIPNLIQNTTYFFQVQAFSDLEDGQKSHSIQVNSNYENPVPIVIVALIDNIVEIDLDLNITQTVVHTGNPVTHMTYIRHEKRIIWFNENLELIMYNGPKTKIATATGKVMSLSVDWIERIIYWVQLDDNNNEERLGEELTGGSSLYSVNLNKIDSSPVKIERILYRPYIIRDLLISPVNQTFYWLAMENPSSMFGELVQVKYGDLKVDLDFPKNVKCLNDTFKKILLDQVNYGEDKLILAGSTEKIYMFTLRSHGCYLLKMRYDNSTQTMSKDSGHVYMLKNSTILGYNHKQNLQYFLNVTQPITFLSYTHQNYLSKDCLMPKQNSFEVNYIPELMKKTENSLLLQLPQVENHSGNCSIKLPSVKYFISYSKINSASSCKQQQSNCNTIITSYDSLTEIKNLKPFTKYQVKIGVNNFYGEQMNMKTIFGPTYVFSTAPGAPSSPRNVTAEPISPTEATIRWVEPSELNSETIWYEIHWETENPTTKEVNRQQRLVNLDENHYTKNLSSGEMEFNLSKLLPSQKYKIWIRAHAAKETYTSSEIVEIETFPEPNNITVVEATAYSLQLKWKPQMNITRYILQYSLAGNDKYQTVVHSEFDERPLNGRGIFIVKDLQPKTMYKFIFFLYYTEKDIPYVWPLDNRFTFETLGDHPSAPGRPIVHHVSGDVYKATWEPAKENGAPIEEYSLESLQSRVINRFIRSTRNAHPIPSETTNKENEDILGSYVQDSLRNYTILEPQLQWVEEPEPIEEKWTVQYNGTDSYWIIKDLNPINMFSFRVRARNAYGWGPYSSTSEPISEPYLSPESRDSLLLAIFVPITVVIICVAFAACTIVGVQKRAKTKKLLHKANSRIPDVELANLRELPRGGNIVQTTNILYSPGPLTDADIALLPQIRRDQITMTSFLGSGAFGEVYEGIVRNVGEVDETRVAIKTLRKGASEQEKDEFLKEAQLMSNFKHEHILKLIGVCFDSDALYIIMELMQGGDLLSYLRQSRPAMAIPSSLTLLDLLSMCVDVASGCRYLEEMHFVHRDLACRNCLVSSVDPEYRVVKIGDFGLARDIYKNDYYRKEGEGLLPVRWMSPESLVDGVFTSQSDIWAFGVLCWEIMTLGQQPYPARNNIEVFNYVRDGGRLGKPQDCPEDLYELMLKCWSYCPEDRPTFRYCLETLQELKTHTSSEIKITASNNSRNGNGTLRFTTLCENIEPPILITPRSSTASTVIPKYLELMYEENEDNNHPQSQIEFDGYEIPIKGEMNESQLITYVQGIQGSLELLNNNNNKNTDRTTTTTISRSNSFNLVNNNNNNNNNNLSNNNNNIISNNNSTTIPVKQKIICTATTVPSPAILTVALPTVKHSTISSTPSEKNPMMVSFPSANNPDTMMTSGSTIRSDRDTSSKTSNFKSNNNLSSNSNNRNSIRIKVTSTATVDAAEFHPKFPVYTNTRKSIENSSVEIENS